MLHFSCDLCGLHLGQRRFVVKLEVYPGYDPDELDEDDLDVDHLQEVSKMIQEMEATGKIDVDDCSLKNYRFDLCPHCHQRFIEDPLGRETLRRQLQRELIASGDSADGNESCIPPCPVCFARDRSGWAASMDFRQPAVSAQTLR